MQNYLFIPKRYRAMRSDRRSIYRYPKYIHFHFGHYAQVEERATGAGSDRYGDTGDIGSGRVLPRANDIVTITVTTYPSTEWWRVTACFDSAKPRGSKIHWSSGCDPAVSMLLGRYVWFAILQRTYYHPRLSTPFRLLSRSPIRTLATLFLGRLSYSSIRPRYMVCHFVMYRDAKTK